MALFMRIDPDGNDILETLIKTLILRLAVYGEIHITAEEFNKADDATIEVIGNIGGTLDLKVI